MTSITYISPIIQSNNVEPSTYHLSTNDCPIVIYDDKVEFRTALMKEGERYYFPYHGEQFYAQREGEHLLHIYEIVDVMEKLRKSVMYLTDEELRDIVEK